MIRNRGAWMFVLLVSGMLGTARGADGIKRALSLVPDNPSLVLVIPSIEQLAAKISTYGRAAGADDVRIDPQSVLERFGLSGIEELDLAGPMVVVVHPHSGEGVICCLRNGGAFVEKRSGKPGQVMTVQQRGITCRAAVSGRMLVISEDEEFIRSSLVSDRPLSKPLARLADGADADLFLIASAENWKPYLDNVMMLAQMSMRAGAMQYGGQIEAGVEFWNVLFEGLAVVIRELDGVSLAIDVDKDRVTARARAEFVDGRVVDYLKAVKPVKGVPLDSLPATDCAAAFGVDWRLPEGGKNLQVLFSNAMMQTAVQDKLSTEVFERVKTLNAEIQRDIHGITAMIIAPKKPATGGMCVVGSYLTDKPTAVRKAMSKMHELSPELMNAYLTGSATSVKHEVVTLAGMQCDEYRFDFGGLEPHLLEMFKRIYGEDAAFIIGQRDEAVAYAMGPQQLARDQLLRLLQADDRMGAQAPVRAVLDGLSPNPQFCVLVDTGNFLGMTLGFAQMFSPMQAMPAWQFSERPTALVALNGYLEPNAIRFELNLPAASVKVVTQTILELQVQQGLK